MHCPDTHQTLLHHYPTHWTALQLLPHGRLATELTRPATLLLISTSSRILPRNELSFYCLKRVTGGCPELTIRGGDGGWTNRSERPSRVFIPRGPFLKKTKTSKCIRNNKKGIHRHHLTSQPEPLLGSLIYRLGPRCWRTYYNCTNERTNVLYVWMDDEDDRTGR